MKAKTFIHHSLAALLIAAVIVFHAPPVCAATASPSELLEKGIYSEETKGDLDGAIAIYQQLISEVKANQSLAAQAQFRLAQCYVKKNQTAEAKAAFEKLIHDFPNEKDLVAKARQHLPQDLALGPVPWVDGERLQMALKLPGGLEIGAMETRADLVESGGKKVWRVGRVMSAAGGVSISTVDVEPDTFRPLASHWKHTLIGEASAVFHPTEVEVTTPSAKEAKKVPVDKIVYDNEECFHLLRRLPMKVGYKAIVPVITTLGDGTVLDIDVSVEKETIQVHAGKFDCFVLALKFPAQTFWFSDDEHHYMVKFEGGGAVGELTSISQRHPDDSYAYHDATGVSFLLPPGWMVHAVAKSQLSKPDMYGFIDAKGDADMAALAIFTTDSLKEEWKKSNRAWSEADFKELATMLKDAKLRADGWQDVTIAGQPGVSFTMDYTEGGKPRVARGYRSLGPKVSTQFAIASSPEKFEALVKTFDGLIASYQTSK